MEKRKEKRIKPDQDIQNLITRYTIKRRQKKERRKILKKHVRLFPRTKGQESVDTSAQWAPSKMNEKIFSVKLIIIKFWKKSEIKISGNKLSEGKNHNRTHTENSNTD